MSNGLSLQADLEGFEMYFQKGAIDSEYYKEAAFLLHQATERFYVAILLVFTDKPKIHDIEKLGNQVEKLHSAFGTVFPKNTPEEKRLFELLQKAYIDSRYDMNYKIGKGRIGIPIRAGETAERLDGTDL